MDANKLLSEILGYYKHKVDHNLCTMEEMNDALKTLESNMTVQGTISDFARFYDVPETTVRTNIFRKMFAEPFAYLGGDIARSVSDIVCELSCPHCSRRRE